METLVKCKLSSSLARCRDSPKLYDPNQVETLPESIGTLGKLEMINVASNSLTEVPRLDGLVSLKRLALFWNKIR